MKLICLACKHEVAVLRDVKTPLIGAMFTSIDEKHGFPPPWSPVVSWQYMYCPMCQKRPFYDPNGNGEVKMITDAGEMWITDDGIFTKEDLDFNSYDPDLPLFETEKSGPLTTAAEPPSGSPSPGGPLNSIPNAVDEVKVIKPVKPASISDLIKSGEVKQNGSWFEYKGTNYRRTDLIKLINGA